MNKVHINTIDGVPVTFVGRSIGQAEGRVECSDGISRQYDLKLYVTDNGRFVPVIGYVSAAEFERSGLIAEEVESAKDVINCFFVFEPEELLPTQTGLSRDAQERQLQLSNRLNDAYKKLTFAILDQLDRFVEQTRPQNIVSGD